MSSPRLPTAARKRDEQVAALQKSLVGWNRQTTWNRFDGTFPHVIPADTNAGLEKDLTLYENAMIFPGAGVAQKDPAKMAFLQIPDMIKLGASLEVRRASLCDRSGETGCRRGQRPAHGAVR